jgi:hypothetical protein
MSITTEQAKELKVFVSIFAAKVLSEEVSKILRSKLIQQPEVAATVIAIAQTFGQPKLTRSLNLAKPSDTEDISFKLEFQGTQVSYQEQVIGQTKILFKSPLPGELQAKLAIESTIDRFLEYLQKVHQIVMLDESDRHVKLFIPNQLNRLNLDFEQFWNYFIEKVVFSIYGLQKYQLPGLAQNFISMLKSITLSDRGFSTLEVPILNREQANVLAAWYFAVWRETKKRQDDRQSRIATLKTELEDSSLSEKDRKTKIKQFQDTEAMQLKEANKYRENFQKIAGNLFEEHNETYQQLNLINSQLRNGALAKSEVKKYRSDRISFVRV